MDLQESSALSLVLELLRQLLGTSSLPSGEDLLKHELKPLWKGLGAGIYNSRSSNTGNIWGCGVSASLSCLHLLSLYLQFCRRWFLVHFLSWLFVCIYRQVISTLKILFKTFLNEGFGHPAPPIITSGISVSALFELFYFYYFLYLEGNNTQSREGIRAPVGSCRLK